ncbi:RagB/SusD family nutrient uptake outer membrane protein [Puia dinghuensis]|nr:RagB/SusD family nutrient uptake outer membrane protein [Puia dinghuensis]
MRGLVKTLLWAMMVTLPFLACKRLVDTPTPQNRQTADRVFSNDAGAQEAMTGCYIDMMNTVRSLMNGGISLDAGLTSDELKCLSPALPEDSFYLDSLTPGNLVCTDLFSTAYNLIYDWNSVLAGLSTSTGVSAPVKAALQGEATFNRAVLYFYLVNLYGDVPLALGTDYAVNQKLPRMAVNSVYLQVVSDLEEAIARLPPDYPGDGERSRPNQVAARALLARVWLYEGQWAAAESMATQVIADGRYQLVANPDSVFLAGSREAIWQLQPVHGRMATADAGAFLRLLAGKPNFVLTQQLSASFETGDLRKVHWTKNSLYGAYPYKYKQIAASGVPPEYEMVLRLAEQYLIRAEARAQEGDVAGAMADLNIVRARSGLAATTATGQAGVLAAILHERRVELFTEWGHRWLDLKRLGQADAVLSIEKNPGWQAKDTLYPIPATQLLASPGMQQNPGY